MKLNANSRCIPNGYGFALFIFELFYTAYIISCLSHTDILISTIEIIYERTFACANISNKNIVLYSFSHFDWSILDIEPRKLLPYLIQRFAISKLFIEFKTLFLSIHNNINNQLINIFSIL